VLIAPFYLQSIAMNMAIRLNDFCFYQKAKKVNQDINITVIVMHLFCIQSVLF